MLREAIRLVHRASRVWLRARGVAIVIVALVALGVGGVAALFSPLYSLVLTPLSLPQPDQLVRVGGGIPLFNAYTNALDDRGPAARLFTKLAVYAPVTGASAEGQFSTGRRPRQVGVLAVTPQFFEALGVLPKMGASFSTEQITSLAIVVSDRMWGTEFGRTEQVLGSVVQLGRQPRTIVGVMPEGFDFPGGVDVWVLIGSTSYLVSGVQSVGRLRPDLSLEHASAELKAMGYKPTLGPSGQVAGRGPIVQSLQSFLRGDKAETLWMLSAASGLFLLLACGGAANLLLAQGVRRRHEVVVQLALGSGRWRLVRQVLMETFVLVAVGALIGVCVSTLAGRWLKTQLPELRHAQLFVPETLVLVAALAAVVTLVCGLVPALHSTRVPLEAALRSTAVRVGAGSPRSGLFAPREWLVVVQLVLALALLIGTGLLLRSLTAHFNLPLGLEPDDVAVFRAQLPPSPTRATASAKFREQHGMPRVGGTGPIMAKLRQEIEPYRRAERVRNAQFLRDAQDRLERLPSVLAAGAFDPAPFTPQAALMRHLVHSVSTPEATGTQSVRTSTCMQGWTSPRGFAVLQARLVAGRNFTAADVASEIALLNVDASTPSRESAQRTPSRVAIVNEALAQRLWPGDNAIGKQFRETYGPESHTVVGVVSNFHWTTDSASSGPAVYYPLSGEDGSIGFVVRLRPGASVEEFGVEADRVVRELMPGVPQVEVHSMRALTEVGLRDTRFATALLVWFSILGMVVASLGAYAASALMAAARAREMGIRIALGATRAEIHWIIVSRILRLISVSVPVGLLVGWALAKQLSHLLFLVTPTDVPTYAISSAVLLAVALMASALPALRAGATDPMVALRSE